MNIFEGSRRIVGAIQIAIVAGTALTYGWHVIYPEHYYQVDLVFVGIATAWIVGFEIFSLVTGWIVRGFMGIPFGKDMLDGD